MKQTFSIGNIVYWLFTYQLLPYKLMAQIKLRFCLAADLNSSNGLLDLWLYKYKCRIKLLSFFHKKKKKLGRVKFLPKAVTVYSRKKEGFDCKNNHKHGKLANLRLNKDRKINYRTLIVLSYILSRLGLRKIQFIQNIFK